MECSIKVLNWNIGGAKYLETKDRKVQDQLQRGLNHLIEETKPHIVCLQEFTQFAESGSRGDATDVVVCPEEYAKYPLSLIDTDRHSHQGKWNNVRKKGGWPAHTYFSQGNAIFVRKDISVFPVWSLPASGATFDEWRNERAKGAQLGDLRSLVDYKALPEDVVLQTGFYRGTRDTEPRAASVLHLVVDRPLFSEYRKVPRNSELFQRPLDVFIVNCHLTTLTNEREGVPSVDARAARRRLGQLDIVFDDVISEYNLWTKDNFRIRGEHWEPLRTESHDRHAPVWILCGDFNFTPRSPEYRYVRDRHFLNLDDKDARTKAKGIGQDPSLTLDYVFVGPAFEALDPKTTRDRSTHKVPREPEVRCSDHYPVCVSLLVAQPDDGESRCGMCRKSG